LALNPEEITAKQASQEYAVSASYLIRKVKEGAIEGRMLGPIWLVKRSSVVAWKASHKKRGGSKKGVPWSKQRAAAPAEAMPPAPAEAPRWLAIDESDPATGLHLQIDALEPGKLFYDASYADGNVQATIHMRPYREGATWYFWDKRYDRVNASAPGRMGGRQESFAKGLLAALEMRMRQALQAAGWEPQHSTAGAELWRYQRAERG
jgi:hypothetical protein